MEVSKNFPQVAFRSYIKLKNYPQFLRYTQAIITTLGKLKSSLEKARFVHEMVDQEMSELYKNENVQKLTACQKGCAACCHTQVSVTQEEADLLAQRVLDGTEINWTNLQIQKDAGTNFERFMQIPYGQRKCVFLKDDNSCGIYEDRPSVCRTNAVVGSKDQCENKDGQIQKQQILNTYNADMIVMGAYMYTQKSGVLPQMLWEKLNSISELENQKKNPQENKKVSNTLRIG